MLNKYFIIILLLSFGCSDYTPKVYVKEDNRGYSKWLSKRRNDPNTQRINWEHYSFARNEAMAHKTNHSRESMQWSELGPSNWGGRTRAFLIDKDDPDKLYAGCVSGGLWSSDDAGMTWYHITTFDECITVASICQTTNGDLYVGTGEGMYENYGEATGGLPGNGIYKSTDGGQSFFHLDSTSVLINDIDTTWAHVNRLAAHPTDPNTVYAATERGVWKTTDGGNHWFKPNGLEYEAPASDIDYAKDGSYILAVIGAKYYKSENGIDFQDLTGSSVLPVNNVGRIELAIAPSDANYAYASIVSGMGKLRGIYQSKDGGLTWASIASGGGYQFEPFAYSSSVYGQGVYDNALGVSLKDPEKIFVGGIRLYSWSSSEGWNKIASTSLSDILYFVHADMHWVEPHPTNPDIIYFANDGGVFKTFNGGKTFTQLTHGYATLQMYAIAVSDSGDVMGGTQDNGTHYVDYKQRTNTSSKKLLGGDGGYASFSMVRPEVFLASYQYPSLMRSINWGESFNHFWDENISPDGEDPSGSFVTPYILWEDKGGLLIDSSSTLSLPSKPDTLTNNVVISVNVDSINDPSVLYYGVNNAIWMTREVMRFDKTPVWYKIANTTGDCESIAVSSDGDIVWAGTGNYAVNGRLYRIKGMRNANYGYIDNPQIKYVINDTSSLDTFYYIDSEFYYDRAGIEVTKMISPLGTETWGKVVTAVAIDPSDPSHVIVGLGNYDGTLDHIYESVNALDSMPVFTSILGTGLVGTPIYSLLIDMNNSNVAYAGSEFGVYKSENVNGNGSATNWSYVGPEKVAVFAMKQVDLSDKLTSIQGPSIFIGTHGRGMWAYNFDQCKDRNYCFTNISEQEKSYITDELYVYPNPSKGIVNIGLNKLKLSEYTLEVYNVDGKLIKKVNSMASYDKISINMSDYLNGLFFVNLKLGNKIFRSRFLLMK